MRISLVFPPYMLQELYNLPPLGLMGLAGCLKDTPHEVTIHDCVLGLRQGRIPMGTSIYEECAREVLEQEPDLVGFSVQCTTYPPALQIARRVKQERPETQILFGGHGTTVIDQRFLERFSCLDFIVRGEGELTFQELVRDLSRGGDGDGIGGLTLRKGDAVQRNPDRPYVKNLDELPPPDYNLVPHLSEYRRACGLPRSIAVLEVGRGCPHHCVYCSQAVQWKRTPRTFSPERIVTDMLHLTEVWDAGCFLLAYDQFTSRRDFVVEFCERVIHAGLDDIPWYCISRLDTVDADLLGLMRRAGCETMCYGIDSGSSRTLSFINKRIDRNQLFQRVRETADQEIVSTLSFVIGFPEENQKDIDQTLHLALRTGALGRCDPLLQLPTVLPGTGLYERYQDRFVRSVDTYFSLGLEFENGRRLAGDDELIDADPLIFSCFHTIPCPGMDSDRLELIASNFPLVIRYFPRSFLLLHHGLDVPPSELFFRFCTSRDREQGMETNDFIERFPVFARRQAASLPTGWTHLEDVIEYEAAMAQVSRGGNGPVFCTEARQPGYPRLRKDILFREFASPVPDILDDIREGIFRPHYPAVPGWLLFHQGPDGLEVTEVNEFGKDFLGFCDGTRSIEEIARALQQKYGPESDQAAFLEACREAEGGLKGERILETAVVSP